MRFILFTIILFISACEDPTGPPRSRCEICPEHSLNSFDCDTDELEALSCTNMIEVGDNSCNEDENICSIQILYNLDFNLTGFQFDVEGVDITDLIKDETASEDFTINYNKLPNSDIYRIVGFYNGNAIPSDCGVLINISSEFQDSFSIEISDILFTNDVFDQSQAPSIVNVCGN